MILWSFMVTTRARLSQFENILLTESGACQSSNWRNIDRPSWGDKLISEPFESKF